MASASFWVVSVGVRLFQLVSGGFRWIQVSTLLYLTGKLIPAKSDSIQKQSLGYFL